jgi:hypothetical protein
MEQHFLKPHLNPSISVKNRFSDVTKVENFDKKCLTLSKMSPNRVDLNMFVWIR